MDLLLNYKLVKLLKYYNDNNLLADEKFILEAANTIIREWKLSDLVKKIRTSKSSSMDEALYDYSNKTLSVWISRDPVRDKEWELPNKRDRLNTYNILVLRLVIRELSKALYFKKKNNHSDLKSTLLHASLEDEILKEKIQKSNGSLEDMSLEYIKKMGRFARIKGLPIYYKVLPNERMAEIDAITRVIKIYPKLSYVTPELLDSYYGFLLTRAMTAGYEIVNGELISPVESFLKLKNGTNKSDEDLSEILTRFSFDKATGDNLYLGLPVPEEEFEQVLKRMHSFRDTKK